MNNITAWACDFSKNTGEGKLARNFVDRFSSLQKVNFFIFSPGSFSIKIYKKKILDIKKRKRSESAFLHRFIFPTFGIFFLLFNFYFKKKKISYLNYCPLWNILIFALLPKNCLLGPITGSNIFYRPKLISILKLLLVRPLYKISLGFIKIKKWTIILSTDVLVDVFKKEKYFNYFENYIIFSILKKKFFINSKYKDIDLLLYYRIHYNKDNLFYLNICKKLSKNFNIHVVGDYINLPNVNNHGQLTQKKVFELLNRTKCTLSTSENILSLFSLEALKFNVKIFYNIRFKKNLLNKFVQFYPISFLNLKDSCIEISKVLKNYKYIKSKISFSNDITNRRIDLFLNFIRY
jgi:hypothetical protein